MKKVFISGPYSIGDKFKNVCNHMYYFNELLELGYAPFNPLLFHFQDSYYEQDYDVWIKIDLEYLLICDAVLVLPGESAGSKIEIDVANKNNIPVYYDIEELLKQE